MRNIRRNYRKNSRLKNILYTHIQNNLKEYTIASLIFIIGVLLGIVFLNNLNAVQTTEINTYITNSITTLKNNDINELLMLKDSITSNITFVLILWLMGSTIIGLLLVHFIVCFKGFCFGYTVSTIIYVLGINKGIIFSIASMLLKNIIAIPCTIALAVSGMKVYKSIMQDRRKENVKLEIIRHSLFCAFILILLLISSIIEIYITQGLMKYCINYI